MKTEMNRYKRITAVLAAIVLALGLSACGGPAVSSGEGSESAVAASSSEKPESAATVSPSEEPESAAVAGSAEENDSAAAESRTDSVQETENSPAEADSAQETGDSSVPRDEEEFAMIEPVQALMIEAGEHVFYAYPAVNSSAKTFLAELYGEPIEVEMHDYGNFEKVGDLPWSLPRNDEKITTKPGDVILYQGNQITIYYDENEWNFTRLASIPDVTREDLLEALGDGDVTVTFSTVWIEP